MPIRTNSHPGAERTLRLAALVLALGGCSLGAEANPPSPPPLPDTTPPTVPTGLAAAAPTPSRVTLSWAPSTDAGTGVGGYEVLRGGTVLASVTAPAAAFEDASVAAGTAYQYTVRAFDRATPPNVSAQSAPAGVTTPTAGPTPGLDARPSNTTCLAGPRPSPPGPVQLVRVFQSVSLAQPIALLQAPGDGSRWYAVEQGGVVKTFPNVASPAATVFVDLSAKIDAAGEKGLLGMAFHPDWPTVPEVFLSYVPNNVLRSYVTRIRAKAGNLLELDPATEETVLELDQPYDNHNGGGIAFGPDRKLHIGFGDGGSGGDPGNRAQNLTTLLGKFLRIDVIGTGAGYAIPSDNPYPANPKCLRTSTPTAPCPEIWAFGVRNPWRWSFDRETGELWAGDVGQGQWEEVDRIQKGKNYGWRFREGAHCYNPGSGCPTPGTVQNGGEIVDPVTEYDHGLGQSITGGYVYRGTAIPSLRGLYVFGDFGSGRIWTHEPGATGLQRSELIDTSQNISSFAEGVDGELYVVGHGGQLNRLALSTAPPTDPIPASLADTGCVDPADPTRPAAGLVPYRLQAPFWSDGAVKDRWMALPDGATLTIGAGGDWDFPNGTVLVKSFRVGGKLVETRLLMRHSDGSWAGYTYEWNDAQTAATRVVGGKLRALPAQSWLYPTEQQCLQCHTGVAGRSLGLETAQQNGDLTYPATGRTANQLSTLQAIGMVSLPDVPANLPSYPDPLGPAPLESRARAYLHSNCSQCHRPTGPTPVTLDLRFGTALAATGTCDAAPQAGDLGLASARVIAPGHPERSVLVERMKRLDLHRMPPVGSLLVDQAGVDLVSAWVTSLTACP